MNSYATLAGRSRDEDLPLIRELMSYDVQCPSSCELIRDEGGCFKVQYVLSPLHWSRQSEWPWAIREAKLDLDTECLDIGCGWGVFKFALAERCHIVDCIDNDQASLDKAWKSADLLGYKNEIHQLRLGDARDIPYLSESFDRVFCISVLEHLESGWLDAVREMKRVLRPSGVLLLTFDVVVGGEAGPPEFHIDFPLMYEIFEEVGITRDQLVHVDGAISASLCGKRIAVALVRWVKPLGGENYDCPKCGLSTNPRHVECECK